MAVTIPTTHLAIDEVGARVRAEKGLTTSDPFAVRNPLTSTRRSWT